MDPLDDVHIDPGLEQPDYFRPSRRGGGFPVGGIVAVVIVILAIVAGYFWYSQYSSGRSAAATATPTAHPAQPDARAPLGPAVEGGELPPLFLTDPLVRELLGRLSSRPELAAWLATEGLIRNFTVCLDNVASGQSPARHLSRFAPSAPFHAEARGSTVVIDPSSYVRYNGMADTAASLDAAGLARVYSRLKPRLIEAYRELGHPEGDIDSATERAIVMLLQAPVIDGDIRLQPKVISYKFEKEDLEELEPVQKLMVRMGPRNERLIQGELRAIARELGIPDKRLPAPAAGPAAPPQR